MSFYINNWLNLGGLGVEVGRRVFRCLQGLWLDMIILFVKWHSTAQYKFIQPAAGHV